MTPRIETEQRPAVKIHIKLDPDELNYLRRLAKTRFGDNLTKTIETAICLGALVYPNRRTFGASTPLEALTKLLAGYNCSISGETLTEDSIIAPLQATDKETKRKASFLVTPRHKELLREVANGSFGCNMTHTLLNCLELTGLVYGNSVSHFCRTPAEALARMVTEYGGDNIPPDELASESTVLEPPSHSLSNN